MSDMYRPNEKLDALRIQAEIETASSAQTRRPTWAPAVVLDGELLELCREVEHLSIRDKPVARLWAVFADPKRKGIAIRTTFSTLALPGIRCRGFEMRAGTTHSGGRMTSALMDNNGAWSVGNVSWGHSDINNMRRWVSIYANRIAACRRNLEPRAALPQISPEEFYQQRIELGVSEERARFLTEYMRKDNAKQFADWEARERRKRDPAYIADVRFREKQTAVLLAKLQENVAKEEVNPDWRHKALTRMTELATQRLSQFIGDVEVERVRGSRVTGACYCCGKMLTDKISLERGIGPECVRHVRTFDIGDLVRLKNEMVAAHPDKGGRHEAFLEAYEKYAAAKAAAESSVTY